MFQLKFCRQRVVRKRPQFLWFYIVTCRFEHHFNITLSVSSYPEIHWTLKRGSRWIVLPLGLRLFCPYWSSPTCPARGRKAFSWLYRANIQSQRPVQACYGKTLKNPSLYSDCPEPDGTPEHEGSISVGLLMIFNPIPKHVGGCPEITRSTDKLNLRASKHSTSLFCSGKKSTTSAGVSWKNNKQDFGFLIIY